MPIQFKKSPQWVTGDNQKFDTLHDAQKHELSDLIPDNTPKPDLVELLLERASDVMAILRQKERKNASPKTRKPRVKAATPATT